MAGQELAGEVRLRGYTREDLAAIFALDEICFEPPFRFSLGMMRRFAEGRNALTVVAERHDVSGEARIAGFCIANVERSGGDRVGYIVTLDVAPRERRRGLAGRLMSEIEQQSLTSGCAAMALHVSVENESAIRFYERSGYGRTKLVRSFYGLGRDAWVYRKLIMGG